MCWGSPSSWSGRVWCQRGSWLWTWIWWWKKGNCLENLWAISCHFIITIITQRVWYVAMAYRSMNSLAATVQILFFSMCQRGSSISTSLASTPQRLLRNLCLWCWFLWHLNTLSKTLGLMLLILLLERWRAPSSHPSLWGYPTIHLRMRMKRVDIKLMMRLRISSKGSMNS